MVSKDVLKVNWLRHVVVAELAKVTQLGDCLVLDLTLVRSMSKVQQRERSKTQTVSVRAQTARSDRAEDDEQVHFRCSDLWKPVEVGFGEGRIRRDSDPLVGGQLARHHLIDDDRRWIDDTIDTMIKQWVYL